MKKNTIWLLLTGLLVAALVLGSCQSAAPAEEKEGTTVKGQTTAKEAVTTDDEEEDEDIQPVAVTDDEPIYGGTLTVITLLPNYGPLSWDPTDGVWMAGFTCGKYWEHLLTGDFEKYGPRGTNEFAFQDNEWIPYQFLTGAIAESWEVVTDTDPMKLVFNIRKGIYFADKPGVMSGRELTADDVVYSLVRYRDTDRIATSRQAWIGDITAPDKYTVVINMNEYNAFWDYLLAWGWCTEIYPHESVEAEGGLANWKNHTGTGPFLLDDYVDESSLTYVRNPNYWWQATVNGKQYDVPFVDRMIELIIPDDSTKLAALRTGKCDIRMGERWENVETLEDTNPELLRWKVLTTSNLQIGVRMDKAPFDDLKVRQALNMALDKVSIGISMWGSEDNIVYPSFPFASSWPETLYTPLDKCPESVQKLYTYDPEGAKTLLADAGYPNGFQTTAVMDNTSFTADLMSLVVSYWAAVGVDVEMQPMEAAAMQGVRLSMSHEGMFYQSKGNATPESVLRAPFLVGQYWNIAAFDDPWFNENFMKARHDSTLTDEERFALLKEINIYTMEQSPYVSLPGYYYYRYTWPWVKNYYGEHNETYIMQTGRIFATLWLDMKQKRSMGY
ncbi:MAG TPA: ABC transporter substrate-binding protein [Dehalococcoidia bacterium]|nr:ABC transporter substrate-binding protein [Dehalococcoidia bacterium]